MRGRRRQSAVGGVLCLLVCAALASACKMEKWPESPSPPPPSGAPSAPATQPGSSVGPQEPAAEAPDSPRSDSQLSPSKSHRAHEAMGSTSPVFDDILEDFAVAESAFMQTTGACTDACRALRSMKRAAARMCAMATTASEQSRCGIARDRVRAAVELVRSSCRTCDGNPPLDDD